MPPQPEITTVDGAKLAFDMIGHAFEALAMLYELRHPGEYAAQARELKEYVADNFRHVEASLLQRDISGEEFRSAVMQVRDLFERVDGEVAAIRSAEKAKMA